MPQVYTQQQNTESLQLVEIEEEELVQLLRRKYGEECVSDEEGGDCAFSVGDANIDEDDM